ncbi:hypothetical protein [Parasitella parasitica]|uniref:Uncharacterized protein n=1 Tax=Parasitella parasitica TaxID=35722 RepID=A0A0B7NF08_9FUNG|nr:hypothetical protein [Parasitella parasitica]
MVVVNKQSAQLMYFANVSSREREHTGSMPHFGEQERIQHSNPDSKDEATGLMKTTKTPVAEVGYGARCGLVMPSRNTCRSKADNL